MTAPLPGVAQEIADVIGRERALYLIGQLPRYRGGSAGRESQRPILYVPALDRLRDDHRLVAILGHTNAEALCRHFGGEILNVPNCSSVYQSFRNRSLWSLAAEGRGHAELSEIFGLTRRRVLQLLAGANH